MQSIAERYGRSPAQILLRWALQVNYFCSLYLISGGRSSSLPSSKKLSRFQSPSLRRESARMPPCSTSPCLLRTWPASRHSIAITTITGIQRTSSKRICAEYRVGVVPVKKNSFCYPTTGAKQTLLVCISFQVTFKSSHSG